MDIGLHARHAQECRVYLLTRHVGRRCPYPLAYRALLSRDRGAIDRVASVPGVAYGIFHVGQPVLTSEFGRRATALGGELAKEMPEVVEAAVGGDTVDRQFGGNEQMAGVADT